MNYYVIAIYFIWLNVVDVTTGEHSLTKVQVKVFIGVIITISKKTFKLCRMLTLVPGKELCIASCNSFLTSLQVDCFETN